MDSTRRRRGSSSRDHGGRHPHFFKIIICSDQYQQIQIPVRFARKYGKELPNSVLLMIPTGGAWAVGVVRSGDEVWLRRGWYKFMNDFSIKLGDFLVFRYEGGSRFHVLIFDKSATEIKYPKRGEMNFNVHNDVEQEKDIDVSEEIPDRSPLRTRVPKPEQLDDEECDDEGMCHDKCKVEIIDEDSEDDVSVKILGCSPSRSRKRKEASPATNNRPAGDRTRRLVGSCKKIYVKDAVMRKAEAVKCKSPSFMAVMYPSKVTQPYTMRIPCPHGRKYLAKKEIRSITLQAVGSNKTWTAGLTVDKQNGSLMMTSGWNDFARGNHLKVGDVCVFEMIRDEDNFYMVHIFRDEDN